MVSTNRKWMTAIAATFTLCAAGMAGAQTWIGGTSDWNTPGNWSGGVPTPSSGLVVIPSTGVTNEPILTSDVTIQSLRIEANRELRTSQYALTVTASNGLDIDSNGTLMIDDAASNPGELVLSGGGASHALDGRIELQSADAKVYIKNNNVTFSGAGVIEGMDSDAVVEIDNDVTLTLSGVVFEGAGEFRPFSPSGDPAVLVNNGAIVANLAGEAIVLQVNLDLFDSASAFRWETNAGGAQLIFNEPPSASLNGDFQVDCGNMHFNQPVTTLGILNQVQGVISTANLSTCFTFDDFGPTSYCSTVAAGSCP